MGRASAPLLSLYTTDNIFSMRKEKATVLSKEEKLKIEETLWNAIEQHPEISFAYLDGSFVKNEGFKDIDLAVYVKEMPLSLLQYELSLETELLERIGKYIVDKFYTLRSLPQFLISVILACPESFLRSRTSRKDSRQAGMTLKTNIQFQTPCGLCRRVLHVKDGMVLFVRDDDERVVVSSLELPYMIYNIDKRKVMQW
jgi:predicted nucleotidyltransferase